MKALAIIFATLICGFGLNMLIRQIRDALENHRRNTMWQRDYQHAIIGFIIMGLGILTFYGIMLWAIINNL